jgi:hypothetical protein
MRTRVASGVSGVPHERRNFLSAVTGAPQLRQTSSSRVPQSSQKRAACAFSAWHRGHFIP